MLTVLFLFLREREELSAVCVFSLSDIIKVMDGPFKELKKTCENWINPEPVPTPRPGQVKTTAYVLSPPLVLYNAFHYNILIQMTHYFFLVFEQCFEGWGVRVLPETSRQGVDICEGPPPDGEQCYCSAPVGPEGNQLHQAGCNADGQRRGAERSSAAPWDRWAGKQRQG